MKTKMLFASIFAFFVGLSANAQWYQQTSGTVSDILSVHCIDGNTCYAVGYLTTLRRTKDGGATPWTTGNQAGGAALSDKYFVKMLNKDTIMLVRQQR